MSINYLKDATFLKQLDNERNKNIYIKIIILDLNENPIKEISSHIGTQGSLNIDGRASMRRTATINFFADDSNNDLQNIENILSINKKIKLLVGIENFINNNYDNIIWFSLGIFLINQLNISHNLQGVNISLTLKDKMCLLNGECGGTLPASITFHNYDQVQADGSVTRIPQLIYDIIQTLVHNYGGIPINKIIINDIPREIKQLVRYTGITPLYYNIITSIFTTDASIVSSDKNNWQVFNYNEDVGYVYTDFVYPGELISGIGETVSAVLDKIKNTLGNYEYFFDVDGNFVFQEVKNYLNNSYDAIEDNFSAYRVYNSGKLELQTNNLNILDVKNYIVDYRSNNQSVYTFEEGAGLISSFTNAPSYSNIKNDFHIWGQNNNNQVIHYHLVLMEKPTIMNSYSVVFLKENDEYTGQIELASELSNPDEIQTYVPSDWRAEMYLQGLSKIQKGQRPNIYEQELIDLFGTIYDFYYKRFKVDIVHNPNNLIYFFDALEPVGKLHNCSITALYPKTITCQEESINKLYDKEAPNIILINQNEDYEKRAKILDKCEQEGQPYANVEENIFNFIAIGTTGYAAHTKARELLYQHTHYNETITLQSIPVYYLDVNRRITVRDKNSNIYGDYVISNISIPLNPGGTMSISATKALERI